MDDVRNAFTSQVADIKNAIDAAGKAQSKRLAAIEKQLLLVTNRLEEIAAAQKTEKPKNT